MRLRVRIVSFSVLRNAISIRLESDDARNLTDDLKGQKRWIRLGDFSMEAGVISISMRKERVNLLLKTRKKRFLAGRLFELMEKEELFLSFETEQEAKLSYLLRKVSEKTGNPEEDLLFSLTTFRGRNNELIGGKRSISEVSKEQQEVVYHKLARMLKVEPEQKDVSMVEGDSTPRGS
jgi:hypothetical protein